CGNTDVLVYEFSATDECFNLLTATAAFIIEDTTAPTTTYIPTSLTVECDNSPGNAIVPSNGAAYDAWHLAQITALEAGGDDACSNFSWSTHSTFFVHSCGPDSNAGSTEVTFSLIDECGNQYDATTVTFTIVDTTN